jgi:hypothetical protein
VGRTNDGFVMGRTNDGFVVGHARRCANSPPHTVQTGRALDSARWPYFVFPEFSELVQIIANFKNLHMIHLTSENYETNFIG